LRWEGEGGLRSPYTTTIEGESEKRIRPEPPKR